MICRRCNSIILIRCVGAEKLLKVAGQCALRTRIRHHWFRSSAVETFQKGPDVVKLYLACDWLKRLIGNGKKICWDGLSDQIKTPVQTGLFTETALWFWKTLVHEITLTNAYFMTALWVSVPVWKYLMNHWTCLNETLPEKSLDRAATA